MHLHQNGAPRTAPSQLITVLPQLVELCSVGPIKSFLSFLSSPTCLAFTYVNHILLMHSILNILEPYVKLSPNPLH